MTEIIPAIIAKNFRELKKKIKKVERYCDWVQLDIIDGKFAPNFTWQEPKDLKKIKTNLKIEVHLMIENPSETAEKWLKNGAKRVIFHWESLGKKPKEEFLKIKEKARKLKGEVGIALNLETPWQKIEKLIPQLDMVLLMAVHPGFSGQSFSEEVLLKIKSLRQKYFNVKIGVDGGINLKTGKKCLEAGADILVSGSYLFESKNIGKAIKKLKNGSHIFHTRK